MLIHKESYIEKKSVLFARLNKWLTYKFYNSFNKGLPDRIFIKNGKVIFVEFKAKNKKPTPLQSKVINDLRLQNIKVFVIDNIEDFKDALIKVQNEEIT